MATIIDYLGKVADIKKPDGTSIINGATQTFVNIGTASNISNLLQSKATDLLKNGVSSIIPDTKSTSGYTRKNIPSVFPNPLEQFASYTVLWTMACLSPDQFNNPASYRNNPQELKNVVFASGGRFDSQRVNTYYGVPEYYINNFQMNCLIGTNEKTGNSNAIKFSFDIYEPYSMGLLLQSMQNAAVNSGYISYLDNTPYVLRMDIQGYDEVGRNLKNVKPKFFTLKLTSMKFSVNEGGSNYKVEAIPYNHQGFSDTINTSYSDLKIFGGKEGNVAEILNTGENSLTAVLNKNEEKLKKEGKISIPDVYDIQFPETASTWYSSAGTATAARKATVNPLAPTPQTIKGGASVKPTDIKNSPINAIGNGSLGFDQLSGGNALFKRDGDQRDPKTGIVKRDGLTIDPKLRAFQFSQGQSLTSMINQVILSSDYAKNAITVDPSTSDGYIKWFKLDVQIELLNYDALVGDYAKKITYRVVPYFVHQSIFANPSSAPVGYNELMKKISKDYNYIYTGQNSDILKFDININNLFYSGTNPKPENEGGKTANQDQKLSEKLNKTTKTGQGNAPAAQTAQLGRSRPKRDPRLLKGYKGGSGDKTSEQNIAENFQQAFLSGNSADMVTVDLEILGDTYWLVDSGMSNYFAEASPTSQVTSDGTMNYESGNVYIYITFRTPTDINEKTGLYDFSVAGKESPFGGIYRVNMCENTFQDGVWKQKLKCLRMPGPQGPEANKKTEGNEPLPISKANNNTTELDKEEPPKTSPIQDTNSSTPVPGNATPANNTTTQATPSPSTNTTTTTSNRSKPVTGFRYYRDLGQN